MFVDLEDIKITITTEKSKKKNVPSKIIKTIQNDSLLAATREAINYSLDNNVKNIFIVAE